MADKKPDLSDLKARLGLTKPEPSPPPAASAPPGAAETAGPPAAGPPAASGPPASAPPASAPPAAGPPAAGPPAAAPPSSGPPKAARPAPTAKPRAKPQATTGPTYSGNAASASIDLGAIGGAGLEQGKTFSGPMIAAMVVAAVVGAGFTWALMSGVNANQLIEIRQNDAKKLRDAVKPKVATFEETHAKIGKMQALIPDLDLAKDVADDDFIVPGSILASVTIPLEGMATDNVANYAADTAALKQMLNDHVRYTKADAEELQKISDDNKAVQENAGFGVVVDPKKIAEGFEKEGFVHERGRLVGFKSFMEKEGKVEITILPAGDVRQVDVNQFVPIEAAEILKAGGQNALQRHKMRIANIKFKANQIDKYRESLVDSLEVAAGGSSSGAAAPAADEAAEEAPAEEPAEAEKAE